MFFLHCELSWRSIKSLSNLIQSQPENLSALLLSAHARWHPIRSHRLPPSTPPSSTERWLIVFMSEQENLLLHDASKLRPCLCYSLEKLQSDFLWELVACVSVTGPISVLWWEIWLERQTGCVWRPRLVGQISFSLKEDVKSWRFWKVVFQVHAAVRLHPPSMLAFF